jgi:hypothetical protein
MVRLPVTVIAAPAVNETLPDPGLLVRLPVTTMAPDGIVLVTDPEELLSVRLPYDSRDTVCDVPEYSVVPASASECVL